MGYDSLDYSYDISQYARSGSVDAEAVAGLSAVFGAFMGVYMVIVFAIAVVQIIAMWKLFTKAGQKGWKSLIPIYSQIIMFRIAKISPWLLLLYFASFIPVIGWIVIVALNAYFAYKLAKAFGKDGGYAVGIFFLPVIFYMILAFGKSEYVVDDEKTENVEVEKVEE